MAIKLAQAWTPFILLVLSPIIFWVISRFYRPLKQFRPLAIFAFFFLSLPSTLLLILTAFQISAATTAVDGTPVASVNLNINALPDQARPYLAKVEHYASTVGLDYPLALAVIEQESVFNPNVCSHAGACGLMQLMPATANALGVTDRFDIDQNLEAGTRHLQALINRYSRIKPSQAVPFALAAYNAGEPAVDRCNCWNPYAETADYVPAVLSRYARLKMSPIYAGEFIVTNGNLHGGDPWLRDQKKWPGVDIAADCGDALYAPISGTVTANGFDGYFGTYGYNNSFMIIENGELSVMLMHGDYIVEVAQYVQAGASIGTEDSQGNSTGCHTHLAVRVHDVPVNSLLKAGESMK